MGGWERLLREGVLRKGEEGNGGRTYSQETERDGPDEFANGDCCAGHLCCDCPEGVRVWERGYSGVKVEAYRIAMGF